MYKTSNIYYLLFFVVILVNCHATKPGKFASEYYFGDVRSTAIGSPLEVPKDFYLKDSIITKTLDSILNSLNTDVSRSKRIFPKWEMNLYSVSSSRDTLCFILSFDSNNLAYVERYSNCYQGLLLDIKSSGSLYQFLSDYFKANNPEFNF